MRKKITRRSFIKKSTTVTASAMVGLTLTGNSFPAFDAENVDISVVKGENYFDNTIKAVDQLGGMEKFVAKNSKVAILANPQRNNPGAFTNPEVVRAAIHLCKKADAKEVTCISLLPDKNWENTGLLDVVKMEKANLKIIDRKNESLFKSIRIPKGKALKEAQIMKEFFNYDVFITIPITKDHAGNKFTGTLKNMMGLNSQQNNRTFHKPGWKTDVNSIRHLDQSIVDLNMIVKPDLCIVDATEFITTNGPFGPGKLLKPQKVVAGVDRVALDAYCCTLWGLKGNDIIMIKEAHKQGLGEINLTKVKIKEISI